MSELTEINEMQKSDKDGEEKGDEEKKKGSKVVKVSRLLPGYAAVSPTRGFDILTELFQCR